MSLFPTETMSQLAPRVVNENAYTPLYRKYRPQALGELVGQENIVQTLSHAIGLQKIVNAYLFCGPRGTGKTSSARIFAKSLNCEQGPTVTPCQVCASCISVTVGNALDVTEIDAASNNGVEDIRELTERVQFAPIQGKFRIYIIDEVHMLSTAAFNALLKTLEEPPPNVIFIFATTEAHKVLPTIISRCQRYDFSRITRQQIEAHLRWVADQEGIAIQPEALTVIARNARGGMRDALSLLDQVSVIGKAENSTIEVELIRTMIGALTEDKVIALTEAITNQQPVELVTQLDQLIEVGIDIPQILRGCVQHYRHMMLIQAVKDIDNPQLLNVLDISDNYFESLKRQAKHYTPEEPPQILTRLSQLENAVKHTASPLLWLEVTLLEICYRDRIHQIASLEARIQTLEQMIKTPGAIKPVPQKPVQNNPPVMAKANVPTSPPATPEQYQKQPITSSAIQHADVPSDVPHNNTNNISSIEQPPQVLPISNDTNALVALGNQIFELITNPSVQSLLTQHAQLIEQMDNSLTFAFRTQPLYMTFNRPEKIKLLEQAAQTILGKSYKLNFIVKAFDVQPVQPVPSAPITSSQPAFAAPEINTIVSEKPSVLNTFSSPARDNSETSLHPEHCPTELPPDYALMESKRFAQELLQGKIIER